MLIEDPLNPVGNWIGQIDWDPRFAGQTIEPPFGNWIPFGMEDGQGPFP